MNHKIFLPFFLAAILLLGACSAQRVEIDVGELADTLLENVEFRSELVFVDETMTKMLYNIDDFTDACAYVSGGATAEEIAVFAFTSRDAAQNALQQVQTRLDHQRESFSSYLPDEVRTLDNAILVQDGCYVILCVSDGDQAKTIITQYTKG